MNPTIQTLILQITWLALQINSQGKWHVFTEISGHCRRINVRVFAADTDYSGEHKTVIRFDTTYEHTGAEYDDRLPVEVSQRAHTALQGLLAELEPYLDLQQLGRDTLAQEATQSEVVQ
ncbi:hypothetical protein [Pseudomonas sp. PA27(2017)]|uniref:hypothetical protein n=1 Tax=Pseudomonas sp. PA27(2017) TaxID=1932112 RepID=UPI00095CD288|nr:hypothetical protein [Pseudomonas sp. PA27(2017)]OLU23851.1 hypothetical protein BVH06_21995 [Pseudomonas sp. PA27(2017)]